MPFRIIPDNNSGSFFIFVETMDPFIYTFKDHQIEISPRRHKKARRLNMRFDPLKNNVILTLPPKATQKHMADFLKKAEGWIQKKISGHVEVTPFEAGTEISLLGKSFTITHQRNFIGRHVKAEGRVLMVFGPKERLNDMVTVFLKGYAKKEFTKICEGYAEQIGKDINKITIRSQKSRWGSCSSQGNISLSWRLLLAPYDVAAYVCAHEVAHLEEMNHSADFWKIVADMSPHYKEHIKWLKEKGQALFQQGV